MSAGFHFDGSGTEGSVEKEARIKSSFKSLEIEPIFYRKWPRFQLSIFYFSRIGFEVRFPLHYECFYSRDNFCFFFEDNLIFSITCVLYIYIRISIILESFFCYVSVIRPQGYYITLNFDTFFFRVYAHLFTSKVF